MKRLILMLVVGSIVVSATQAQETKKMEHDPTLFIGQWEAKVGEITYLLTIEKTIYLIELFNINVETLIGGIVTKKGNTIIRDAKIDGPDNSILTVGNMVAFETCTFNYKDKEKNKNGKVTLKLNEKDSTKAYWMLLRYGGGEFDYPLEMTFRKVK